MIERRELLVGSLAGLAATACSDKQAPKGKAPDEPRPAPTLEDAKPNAKKILILGGTGFLGPHVVDAALARGHTVTLFNRGKTHPTLFPGVEKLVGDRDGKLEALANRSWDAVVDTSGYVPRIVKQSVALLAPKIEQYLFISTMSVYANSTKPGVDESAAVRTLANPASEDVGRDYGALKAACERVCEATMPGRVANLRAGWIVGPLDPTGRFTYWPNRMAAGGEVLAPGDGRTPVQLIDGRDLGAWIVKVIEGKHVGVFNALGPSNHPQVTLTMKQLIDACNQAAGNKATVTGSPRSFSRDTMYRHGARCPAGFPPVSRCRIAARSRPG